MLVDMPTLWTIVLDFVAWFVIHVGVSYVVSRPRADSFDPNGWLYRERHWEREGRTYEKLFGVKRWKRLLPDGAALFKGGFRKKRLQTADSEYFSLFVRESCRAELTHWVVFAFGPLFFIWNPWYVGIVMIVYATVVNMPCIVTQRYNRIRLTRLLGRRAVSRPAFAAAVEPSGEVGQQA